MAYVYGLFYENENNDKICFYIGKGTGNRDKQHLQEKRVERLSHINKYKKIASLRKKGVEPFSIRLVENLSEDEAYILEEKLLKKDKVYEQVENETQKALGAPKGRSITWKDKISKAKKGQSYGFQKGNTPWNAGKKNIYSEETLEKLRKDKADKSWEERYGKEKAKKMKEKLSKKMKISFSEEDRNLMKKLRVEENKPYTEIHEKLDTEASYRTVVERTKEIEKKYE